MTRGDASIPAGRFYTISCVEKCKYTRLRYFYRILLVYFFDS